MGRKTQHILVFIQDNNHIRKAIVHAFKLASIFKAHVAFVSIPSRNNGQELPFELIDELNSEKITYQMVNFGNLSVEPNNTIKQLEAIFIVTEFPKGSLSSFKRSEVFRYLYRARIPSILIGEHTDEHCRYQNITVPVDFKRETKEKMIWASYFGRFNQAVIHLFAATHKAEGARKKIKATLIFTKRMYEQFNFDYKIEKSLRSSNWLRQDAYSFSEQYDSDLMVLLSQKNDGLLNKYFGPPEIKKYLRRKKNPILFINPLKDYYLPCN
ncbi:hypothetical protein [Marinifilum caeruleilacunae]|jgi:hypothetical protein|uniref:Universal stress protein n=1 Tax=Marinifilum caeruleilacunae TaxID=2499076 RepID=A0ABX1WU14_9BACT|nr:hypothetical protein [Marinifilum caeruleilacunae]NOU59583.1 hypothetical protein [Marinifilum caeruleilacunae]